MENMVDFNFIKKNIEGKKVLLTGHTGFKGSWMLMLLNMFNAKVSGISLVPKNQNDIYNLINGDSLCDSIISDIRNKDQLREYVLKINPEIIFHFAAQPLVRESYKNPIETFETNIIGTANLLDAVRFIKTKCTIVVITTDKVYENKEWHYPYRENDRLGGYDPYSSSKAASELIIDSYRNSFFNPVNFKMHLKSIASARAGNVIGGGDWSEDRLIPDIIRSINSETNILIRNPNSVRPWQHVLEPLLGYLLLAINLDSNPLKFSSSFNFGPNDNDVLSVIEIANICVDYFKKGVVEIRNDVNSFHEASLLKLDINKSREYLGWQPKLSSLQSIAYTLDWYKYSGNNEREYCMKQIKSYYEI